MRPLISQNLQSCLRFFLHPANKPDFLTANCAKASTMFLEKPSFFEFYEETNYAFLCWKKISGFYHLFWKIYFFFI